MRARLLITPFLSLALLLVGLWGYSQFAMRRQWETRAETQYQRAFIDLTNNLGTLETNLARASVSNSPRFLRQTFADIWRLSYAAQEKLGQLPLGAVELTRMKMLLAKVGAFSYQVTDRPADTLRLTSEDWNTLQGLRSQARYVSGQLTSMQANIVQNNLRWVDVERLGGARLSAAVAARRIGTNGVTKSLTMVENGLKRMPDPGFPESAVVITHKPKGLTGRRITAAEGKAVAEKFVAGGGSRQIATYMGQVKGDMPSFLYSVAPPGKKGAAVKVSVTEQGGRIAWMLMERIPGARRLNLAKATDVAERFIRDRAGLPDMTVIAREEYANVDVITLAPKRDGVIYYPELVKVSVAMDTGQVVGYEGVSYLTFHDPARKLPEVRLSAQQARERVSPHLQVESVRQVMTVDNRQNEVLAYEVAGTMKGERFLVYLNTHDGTEIKIRRVDANGVEIE